MPNKPPLARRIFRVLATLLTLAVLAVGLLLSALWLEHRTDITLPAPTGSFPVARSIYDWTDERAVDTLAPVPAAKRELLVSVWYPAAAQSATTADYLPPAWRRATEHQTSVLLAHFLTRDLWKVHTHSTPDAPVSPQQRSYPVVVMRAGASLEVASYSTLAEDLASHGYVVIGFDAPYRTGIVVFPDGRVMKRLPQNNPELCVEKTGPAQTDCVNELLTSWTADIGFVLDRLERLNASDPSGRFAGRLDMARVGVFGHSFGGAQAAQFCSQDPRCKAGIDIDGAPFGSVIQNGMHKPFMFLLSGKGDFSSDAETRQIYADIQSIYSRLPADARLRVVIRGANHFTFSDDGALLKSRAVRGLLRVFGKLGIDGRRQLAITAYCVHSFFDVYLKGAKAQSRDLSFSLYPEVQILE